jgi:outer membrane lipoprotein LolB
MLSRLLLFGFLVVFIGGCARQPLSPVENFERYQRGLAAIEDWQLRGKMNLRVPGDSETVRVSWDNQADSYDIRLSGTLGMGATWIRGDHSSVRLEQGGQEPVVAATPEELVYTQLGREIPISELRYWVRGLPAPYPLPEHMAFTPTGVLSHIDQSGWSIQYSDYRAVGSWNLPGKILASRDDLRLTLLVSHWSLDTAD